MRWRCRPLGALRPLLLAGLLLTCSAAARFQAPQFAVPAWVQSLRPIRLEFDFQLNDGGIRDCLAVPQDVMLGQPDVFQDPDLARCESAYGRIVPTAALGLQDSCWLACMESDVVSPPAQLFLMDMVQSVKDEFEEKLQLLWPQDSIQLPPPQMNSLTGQPLSACPMLEPPVLAALGTQLDTLTQGDLHVFVTARPTFKSVNSESYTCLRDGFGRPVVSHLNVNAVLLQTLAGDAVLQSGSWSGPGADMMRNVLRHEMMHVLALTWTSLQQFRGPDRRLLVELTSIAAARNAVNTPFLVTPWAKYAVELQFNASMSQQLIGMELSGDVTAVGQTMLQEPPPSINNVHLSLQVASSDVSTALYDGSSVLSALSLAVLGDSGWYLPDMDLAEPLWWGRGQSQSFLVNPTSVSTNPAAVYNCDTSQTSLRCAFDRRYKGYCAGTSLNNALPSTLLTAQASTSSAVWPQVSLGSCINGPLTEDFLTPTLSLVNSNGSSVEMFGAASLCHMLQGSATGQFAPVCLPTTCNASGISITTDAAQPFFCPYNVPLAPDPRKTTTVTLAGTSFVVTCPLPGELCPLPTPLPIACPNSCSNQGQCGSSEDPAACVCDGGWTGADCSTPTCAGVSPPCTGHGTCNSDGTCSCNDGYTGVDCGMPTPTCEGNCVLLGEGFSCFSDRCEQQCSAGGRSCVAAGPVLDLVPECQQYLSSNSFLCIPNGPIEQVVNQLRIEMTRQRNGLSAPSLPAMHPADCASTVDKLVCFTVFRECQQNLNLELPLCQSICNLYEFDCNAQVLNCNDGQTWASSKSSECSGNVDPASYLTTQRLLLYLLFAVATVILLIALAWLLRIWFRYHGWACFGGAVADGASHADVGGASRRSSPEVGNPAAADGGPGRPPPRGAGPWLWARVPPRLQQLSLVGWLRPRGASPPAPGPSRRVSHVVVSDDSSTVNPYLLATGMRHDLAQPAAAPAHASSSTSPDGARAFLPLAWEPELQDADGDADDGHGPLTVSRGLGGVTMGHGGWATDPGADAAGLSNRVAPLQSAFAGDGPSAASTQPWMHAAWADRSTVLFTTLPCALEAGPSQPAQPAVNAALQSSSSLDLSPAAQSFHSPQQYAEPYNFAAASTGAGLPPSNFFLMQPQGQFSGGRRDSSRSVPFFNSSEFYDAAAPPTGALSSSAATNSALTATAEAFHSVYSPDGASPTRTESGVDTGPAPARGASSGSRLPERAHSCWSSSSLSAAPQDLSFRGAVGDFDGGQRATLGAPPASHGFAPHSAILTDNTLFAANSSAELSAPDSLSYAHDPFFEDHPPPPRGGRAGPSLHDTTSTSAGYTTSTSADDVLAQAVSGALRQPSRSVYSLAGSFPSGTQFARLNLPTLLDDPFLGVDDRSGDASPSGPESSAPESSDGGGDLGGITSLLDGPRADEHDGGGGYGDHAVDREQYETLTSLLTGTPHGDGSGSEGDDGGGGDVAGAERSVLSDPFLPSPDESALDTDELDTDELDRRGQRFGRSAAGLAPSDPFLDAGDTRELFS